jgi:phage terminase large subunit GpA-like protein
MSAAATPIAIGTPLLHRPPPCGATLRATVARILAPRRAPPVSDWADQHRVLTSKSGPEAGRWRTSRNPPLREPMDCFSLGSPVQDVALKFPIQFGKSEVLVTACAYTMANRPGPIMVAYPSEVSRDKGVNQKWQPMFDGTPALRGLLSSTNSRETSNSRFFKDYEGGQWYAEHAGSPVRMKSTSVQLLEVDELDEVAAMLPTGDDPLEMLLGRTSVYASTAKRLYVSTPQLKSTSRIEHLWERSDQRRYHVPCPHCGEPQPMEWAALQWSQRPGPDGLRRAWLVCRECGAHIDEHHKTAMILAGAWVPGNPAARIRGYHINCLYYPVGLGPRWPDLVEMWLDAQGDPARLKTFINDRLAEPWEDASQRHVKASIVQERAEPYPLRTAPPGVVRITAGVDTQDNRLAVQVVGWGANRESWVLDYVELPGDPAQDAVWTALTDLLNRPIQHASGATLSVEATCVDMGGHRTEAVKSWVRSRVVRRPMAIFGAVPNNAPILGKSKMADVTWRGQYDKRGVMIYQVGTVAAKHALYARLAADADAQAAWANQPDRDRPPAPDRGCHFSDQLPPEYFAGLISEVFNPSKNRFEKRRGGVRNEPLDTWIYAYAATHHPELRLHRATRADWARWAQRLEAPAAPGAAAPEGAPAPAAPAPAAPAPHAWSGPARPKGFAGRWRG